MRRKSSSLVANKIGKNHDVVTQRGAAIKQPKYASNGVICHALFGGMWMSGGSGFGTSKTAMRNKF